MAPSGRVDGSGRPRGRAPAGVPARCGGGWRRAAPSRRNRAAAPRPTRCDGHGNACGVPRGRRRQTHGNRGGSGDRGPPTRGPPRGSRRAARARARARRRPVVGRPAGALLLTCPPRCLRGRVGIMPTRPCRDRHDGGHRAAAPHRDGAVTYSTARRRAGWSPGARLPTVVIQRGDGTPATSPAAQRSHVDGKAALGRLSGEGGEETGTAKAVVTHTAATIIVAAVWATTAS